MSKLKKKAASQFIQGEAAVTFRAPKGFYGNFGVQECDIPEATNCDDDDDDENSSSSHEKVFIKKPKKGFIQK